MRLTHLFFLLIFFTLIGCKEQGSHLSKIEGKRISISDSISNNEDIENFIKPYRERINSDLDSVIAFSTNVFSKKDGTLNTAIGNFMADAVFSESNPIFKSRTGKDIDLVLLNHGGIRSVLPKGDITKRTAFEIMPFENSIVVVALKGHQVDSLVSYLVKRKRAHPISKLKIVLDAKDNLVTATVKDQPINRDKTYYVATNDYLYKGNDGMTFFRPNDSLYTLNYKIRNTIIDKFNKLDTINPVIDDRFIQIKE
ncbi:5'-nucleotidase C-terminal domain-containing protein [Seonamhaeicola marinus]|uniref:5'-Nucleotidase C-terminal domain-containing protein n=1 Tax=Seonamhaeicola marinus TaxID=1912246 RepID=A0A5D0HQ40_9FLAO|nr:5'-nucleotidase [Seonamhaeicola marinus]TYA71492.1 hypothetical protein FUA24_18095 [Seonamhaeicola marinus]